MFAALSLCSWSLARPTPLGTAFNYQGQLKQSGNPLNATADFEFKLFNAVTGGVQVGSTSLVNNVNIVNGLFTVSLDFGVLAFNGDQRWVEAQVRSPAGGGNFTTLTPRQALTATPYALYALTGPGSGGPWAVNGNNVFTTNTGNVGIGTTAPLLPLHIEHEDPVIILQDESSASQQSGYLGFWNNVQQETGWVGFGTPGSPHFSIVNARDTGNIDLHAGPDGNIRLITQVEALAVDSIGRVGIGTSMPSDKLSVAGSMTVEGSVFISNSLLPLTVDLDSALSGTLVRFQQQGSTQGFISVNGTTVSYNGFMGSHYAWMDDEYSIDCGALVRMTGENRRLNDCAQSDVVYGIEPTASANDPACLGAYLGIMESDKPEGLANPHLIAAVGNGEMLVVDSGTGDIQPGDYLISSDVSGCAMKDDPRRFAVGHVIARAGQRIDWSTMSADSDGRNVARASVFFESFVRSGITESVAPNAQKDGEIAKLNERIAQLERLVNDALGGHSTAGRSP